MPPCLRDSSPSPTRREHDSTVLARRQPIARPTGPHRPLQFLATDHRPLITAAPQSRPAVPGKSLRNVLYCKVEPDHNQAGPERAASHTCPPTIPGPPTMSTCSEPNVRNQPPANMASGTAAANPKCGHLPTAAPPTRCETKPAMQPMPAPPSPGSVSCHKEPAADTVLRTSCTNTPSFAHFQSKTDRELTATASCYESPCQYPVTSTKEYFSKRDRSGRNRAFRYPIDTLPILDFRNTRSRFASRLDAPGPKLDRTGPIPAHLRGATDKETDTATDFDYWLRHAQGQ